MTLSTPRYPFAMPAAVIDRHEAARANATMMDGLPVINLLNADLHAISEADTVQIVIDELAAGRDGSILTMNLDHLRRYNRDAYCRDLYARSTLHVADGMPLVWASRVQGTPLPERVTGSNLIWSLSEGAAENGRSVFLLGGEPGTAQEAAKILQKTYPKLKVAGTFCPDYGFEQSEDDMTAMTEAILSAQPDIVYVALGTPKQDKLIEILRDYRPACWWVGVGISFSFVCGTVVRAPVWMQRTGLEWVHRMWQEPGRLAHRYLVNGLPYFMRLLAHTAGMRIFGR